VTLVYDIGDAGDYTSDQPNGSKAARYQFVQYATNSAVIAAAGDTLLDTQVTPSSFPQFPVNNKPVPANSKVRLLAIAACPSARGNASANKGYTTFLKLIRDREVLFDEDRNGLPFLGDAALVANAETYDPIASVVGPNTNEEATPALVLGLPLEFGSGEELDVYVTVAAGASGGIGIAGLDVALVLEVERAA
jgi:hypothetical protein